MTKNSQLNILHPLQLRCARILLEWSVADAVAAVGISASTLNRAEKTAGRDISVVAMNALRLTYEQHGIEFLCDDGVGVKLRPKTES